MIKCINKSVDIGMDMVIDNDIDTNNSTQFMKDFIQKNVMFQINKTEKVFIM